MKKVLACAAMVAAILGNSYGMNNPEGQDVGGTQNLKQTNVAEVQDQDGYYTLVSGETVVRKFDDKCTYLGSSAYEGWYNLASIVLPANITRIGSFAFASCYNLKEVKSKNVITYIGQAAFAGCTSLVSVTLFVKGITVNTSDETDQKIIKDSAFLGCKNLRSIKIPIEITEIAYNAFEGCCSLSQESRDSIYEAHYRRRIAGLK